MSINATTPAHAAETSSDEDSAPLSASSSSSSHASPTSSSHASTSATTSASSHTNATATPTADPTRDAILETLLAELFGLKAEASSNSHTAPTPCFDPAVWAACQGSSAAMSTMTTVQLLIAMRQGAPYTVEKFIETFAMLARVFKQTYDELRRADEAEGVTFP